jgi:hypothetical protein
LDWIHKIGSTRDQQQLLALTREYLAAWYHADLAQIAEDCRPTRVRDVDDIAYWTERLAEGYCGEAVLAEHPDRHREMLDFYMAAAHRAAQVPAEVED